MRKNNDATNRKLIVWKNETNVKDSRKTNSAAATICN